MRYLVLPLDGIRASDRRGPSTFTSALLRALKPGSLYLLSPLRSGGAYSRGPRVALQEISAGAVTAEAIQVIASVAPDGPKLIEASPEAAAALRQRHPGIRVVEEQFVQPCIAPRPILPPRPANLQARTAAAPLIVRVVRADTGAPVAGADLYVYRTPADALDGRTNRKGEASLDFGVAVTKVAQLLVYHELPGLWGGFQRETVVREGKVEIALAVIDLGQPDSYRYFHGDAPDNAGKGVRVGIIDAGADTKHPDLVGAIEGGLNCVPGSKRARDDYEPAGAHGTHVAGLVAATGRMPRGMRGGAPAAKLRIYRVFEDGNRGSGSSFAIIHAIEQAIADRCDIINLSLGMGPGGTDPGIADALRKARAHGILPIAAAGNDGHEQVTFPASEPACVAVSAAGRKDFFPANATEVRDVAAPYGTDRRNFLGAFSNIGGALDAAGAGVGVVSTFPKGYGAMSGTSMSSPAIAGVAARLLSMRPAVLKMPRNATRSDAIRKVLLDDGTPLGFGKMYEGAGLMK